MKQRISLTLGREELNLDSYVQIPGTNTIIAREESLKGKDWDETIEELSKEGLFMPPLASFIHYFMDVIKASKGKTELFDGKGSPLPRAEVQDLYKKLTRNVWTWLDTMFVPGTGYGNLDMETNHRAVNGNLTFKKIPLEKCLMEDGYASLRFNSQGLPVKKSRKHSYEREKNICFYYPRENLVARFRADSVRADLDCGGIPRGFYGKIGVIACAKGTAGKNF